LTSDGDARNTCNFVCCCAMAIIGARAVEPDSRCACAKTHHRIRLLALG
jgi:hypothetical protein